MPKNDLDEKLANKTCPTTHSRKPVRLMTEVTSNDILLVSASTSCTLLVKLLVDQITNAQKYPNEYFITFSIDDAQVLLYSNWSIVSDGFDESMDKTFL